MRDTPPGLRRADTGADTGVDTGADTCVATAAGTAMQPRVSFITLAVEDLERAVRFYRDGLGWATRGIVGREFESGAVAFFNLQPGLKLALWPRDSLAREAGVARRPPSAGELVLSHNVDSRAAVDAVMQRAADIGGVVTRAAQPTFYGGYAGFFQDPDGHLWEVVFNPGYQALG